MFSFLTYKSKILYFILTAISKHRIAKNFAESAKNVKNITKTLSVRQQMRAASGRSSLKK